MRKIDIVESYYSYYFASIGLNRFRWERYCERKYKNSCKKNGNSSTNTESASGLTVGELVSYGRFPYQKGFGRLTKRDFEMIDWALEVTGTTDFKYRPVDSLSGGQRQRVWIAMALAQETDIIFLMNRQPIWIWRIS